MFDLFNYILKFVIYVMSLVMVGCVGWIVANFDNVFLMSSLAIGETPLVLLWYLQYNLTPNNIYDNGTEIKQCLY